MVTQEKWKLSGESTTENSSRKALHRREELLKSVHAKAEIQRNVFRGGKNLAFSEDIFKKERERSKVIPRKVERGAQQGEAGLMGIREEVSHLLGLKERHERPASAPVESWLLAWPAQQQAQRGRKTRMPGCQHKEADDRRYRCREIVDEKKKIDPTTEPCLTPRWTRKKRLS